MTVQRALRSFMLVCCWAAHPHLLLAEGPPQQPEGDVVKTEVYEVGRDHQQQYVAFLHDADGRRFLPIWIGECEALAIARKLYQRDFPRPLTHDLFQSVLESTGVRIASILVDELRPLDKAESQGTYFAVLTLQRADGTTVQVDSRPSDAMAMAVRMGLSIYVSRKILENHGIEEKDGPKRPAPPEKAAPRQYY